MTKLPRRLSPAFLLTFCLAVTAVPASQAAQSAKTRAVAKAVPRALQSTIRIVSCDQKVQSRKRGLCANHLGPEDFKALAPGVSWFYNWYFETADMPPKGVPIEYIPMVWGDRPTDLAGIERSLAAGHRPKEIFAINEPNLRGQAFISPEQTAAAYAKVEAIADKYHIPVIGPHMAIGSAAGSSITAMDPIDQKEVTYTFMVPFLKAFLFDTEKAKTKVPAVSFHSYGNIGEMRWAVGMMHKEFDRPVWVTEYAQWKAPDAEAARTYLIQSTDLLERSPFVQGYAWFKERTDSPNTRLLAEPGRLTPLGETYVAMPVHEADLYYRIPGRLQAENYVALDRMEVWPTSDVDGFLHVAANEPGAWVDYNVQVDKAGTYVLRFRVTGGSGKITISEGDTVLASVDSSPAQDKWSTMAAQVRLPTGAQTIRLRCETKGQAINWIEFIRP